MRTYLSSLLHLIWVIGATGLLIINRFGKIDDGSENRELTIDLNTGTMGSNNPALVVLPEERRRVFDLLDVTCQSLVYFRFDFVS